MNYFSLTVLIQIVPHLKSGTQFQMNNPADAHYTDYECDPHISFVRQTEMVGFSQPHSEEQC